MIALGAEMNCSSVYIRPYIAMGSSGTTHNIPDVAVEKRLRLSQLGRMSDIGNKISHLDPQIRTSYPDIDKLQPSTSKRDR